MKSGFVGVLLLTTLTVAMPAVAGAEDPDRDSGRELWQHVGGQPRPASPAGARPAVRPRRYSTFTLDRGGMAERLAAAPRERSQAARERPLVLALPAPDGGFQRFAVQESPIIEPGLAARHPEIKTYGGRGIDNRAATIRFDLTPLGFHASVRGPGGAWYVDPYYHLDQSLYVSYYGRDLPKGAGGTFVERESDTPDLSVNGGRYRTTDTVRLQGRGFAADARITVTVSDAADRIAPRTVEAIADASGAFEASFVAGAEGGLESYFVEAADGTLSATTAYRILSGDGASFDLVVGDQLRTYRLALITDPAYATYFGGPANVTAAKVTLINRVNQIYEDETSIRMVLVASNDLLNLDTAALATGANGPCGTAGCFTAAQVASCNTLSRIRIVTGQIIGASNYDIGHLALGGPGGGVASLGVVGRSAKAQGCTGVTTPTGDFFAVDYVAHEMGHQFAGNHPFNGTQSSCSGGNRSASNSVEPGSGSSIMAYAGICGADNLQPHSDPYWSQRSFQEVVTYVTSNQAAINEVQTVSLRNFDTDGDSFTLSYNGNDSAPIVRGPGYTAAAIQAAIQGIPGWPGGTVTVANFGGVGAPTDDGFQVTFNSAPLAGTSVTSLALTNMNGATGFVGETDKGGPVDNKGFTVTPTGNSAPVVTVPPSFTIPLRTPFALTGSATDADGDTLTYLWEQNDRGGAAGTALLNNTKVDGALFRQFSIVANVTPAGTLQYNSPGENAVTTNPTRVFPDLPQILANNTNAETGTCSGGNVDCFSEFLPTADYVGVAGVNQNPLSLHFRLTVRDGNPGGGGVNSADTTLLLATGTGPFLVTSPNTAVTYPGGSSQTVTWSVANTNVAPISATDVKISLSLDGGLTYPQVLLASAPNDGSQSVMLPNLSTTEARVKIEAVGNVFFDVSNANFTITASLAAPVVTHDAPVGGATVQHGAALSPTVTVSASDADSFGSTLNASAPGLPAGLSLAVGSTSPGSTLPGTRTWTVVGNTTAAPATYNVTVTVTDGTAAASGSTSFAIIVSKAPTSTTLVSSANPSNVAQGVTFTATTTAGTPAAGIPTGTVTFRDGASPLGTSTLDGSGQATLTTAALGVGPHTITAEYGGDAYFNGSTSPGLSQSVVAPSVDFFTLLPCRVVDTRGGAPVGGPVLDGQATRVLTLVGHCGIPVTAKAVSLNLAVTQSTAGGNLRLFPAGVPVPLISSINYSAGQTRANNAVIPLSVNGEIGAFVAQPLGTTVHLVIDVNGYFE